MKRKDLDRVVDLEEESKEVIIKIASLKNKLREVLVEHRNYEKPDPFVTRWINSLLYSLSIVADDEQKKEIKTKSNLEASHDNVELSTESIKMILGWKEFPITSISRRIADKDLSLIQEALSEILDENN